MRSFSIAAAVGLLSLLILPSISCAANSDDDGCRSMSGSAKLKYGACSRVIASGRYAGADLAWAYYERGIASNVRGNDDLAVADLSEAIRLRSNYADAYASRCWTTAPKRPDALGDCDRAIELRPNDPELLLMRGQVNWRLNRLAEAKADFTAAIVADSNFASAYWERAEINRLLGDSSAADADIAAAKKMHDHRHYSVLRAD